MKQLKSSPKQNSGKIFLSMSIWKIFQNFKNGQLQGYQIYRVAIVNFFQVFEKIKLIINIIESSRRRTIQNFMKNTMIKIGTNNRNAIQINWNFSGLLMPKIFRRHVFLCPSKNEQIFNRTLELLDSCYGFFKNGDLYSMAVFNQPNFDWFEKTKIEQVSLQDFEVNRCSSYKNDLQGLASLLKKLTKYREPTFVTICNDGNVEGQQIEKLINDLREKKDLGCLFMISSKLHKEKNIQFSKGICYIGHEKSQISSLYKYYDEHLACLYAQITLQSQSGNIFMKSNNWKSLQFSILSRKIYYPLARNLTDLIQTYRLCSEERGKWNFKIQLKYKLLNGSVYTGRKQIEIPLIPSIEKFVTYNKMLDSKNKNYELCIGVELKENPFFKQYMLDRGI